MTLMVNIIGAGNLGKTIGNLLARSKLVKIGAICNKTRESTVNAIQFIGDGEYCSKISELPSADITFITTPDDYILSTCEALSENKCIKKGDIVLHCSGSLTSDILSSVKNKGLLTASIHPMRSFAKPEISIQQYTGTFCAMEGEQGALSILSPLFQAIGSITYVIKRNKKSLYHAAGVFASNYLVALSQQALSCMREAGMEDKTAMQVITSIMKSTVSNLEQTLYPAESLTGPIQRGDVSTIKKHVHEFIDAEQRELYISLGLATMPLTQHGPEKKNAIKWALSCDDLEQE